MHLPPELRDSVIDLLQNDRAALRACSLTCRPWLPRSRHHLFRSIQIEPGRRGAAFRTLLDANPDIGQYVQDMEIFGSGSDIPIERVVRMEWPTLRAGPQTPYTPLVQRCVLDNVLPKSTKVLRRVSCLRVVAMHIHSELVDILLRHFSAINTLVLNKCRSATFADFIALPRGFREVSCLKLHDIHWLRPTPPSAVPALYRRTLKTLVLSQKTDVALLLTWLVAQEIHTTLESLSCHSSGQASAIAICSLLKAVGSSLRHLAFGFSDVKDPTALLQRTELSLEPCTGLRRLHIYCTNSVRYSSMPSLSWILILLSKINSSHLYTLELSIPSSHIPALNFVGLSVVLSHPRCACLQRLIFHVHLRGDRLEEVGERIKSRVSSLTAKGLDVEVVGTDAPS
ncbi:hypothetical protein BC835DRAFT_1281515 [Cytidiella melzeri]|nr:hypothetical protein BC835DRAFT_1281515 [Cytidiella melzeri]